MAKSFDNSFDQREQIRDAIDIVDLVERYVPLRRQGANFVYRCPWHDDTRPSLQVNAQRQTFKCWVCDIGGDAFSFVMKMENVDFKESMQILADMAGIELIKRRRRTPGRSLLNLRAIPPPSLMSIRTICSAKRLMTTPATNGPERCSTRQTRRQAACRAP